MKHLIFNQEEFPTNEEQIKEAEEVWGTAFPEEYKTFLLAQNGGQVFPNIPSIKTTKKCELWWIERFCSVNDLILQKKYPMGYTYFRHHKEYKENLKPYKVSRHDLLAIAVSDRGPYYINLSKKQYGQIYHASYQGGDGFVKLKTKSFNEFLNSFKPFPEAEFKGFEKTRKVCDSRFYYTPEKPQLGMERFKEVLSFLGDANSKARDSDWTVIQHYAHVDPYDKMGNHIFEHLLNHGGNTEGLLLRIKNFATMEKLIKEYGADFNQPYKGRYPIHLITGISSWNTIKVNYELLDKLLNSDIEIDLSIKDQEGRSPIDRMKKMVIEYEKYREYDKKFWKSRPENHNFLSSKAILQLIEKN